MRLFTRFLPGVVLFTFCSLSLSAQKFSGGQIHGSFQLDAQTYTEDTIIGAPKVDEKMLGSGFLNLIYTSNNFEAGVRYEAYLNPLQGIDPRYKGQGIANRYAKYRNDDFEVTVGHFYEQFGSGMILRAYQEYNLGFDNAIDGIRMKYNPFKGATVKALIGKQRYFWDHGPGIVRGIDGELYLNDLFKKMATKKTKIRFGGSFVSKFQEDRDPQYFLPENVASFAGRMNVRRGKFSLNSEYVRKCNDPSTVNQYIYKYGEAMIIQGSYSQKGLGISLEAKYIDNMDFRSNRTETVNSLLINYLPAFTKQHTYTLSALYPYATQPTGEMGYQANVIYNIKKGSKLGGKYGTTVSLNYSFANSIDKQALNDTTAIGQSGTLGYTASLFGMGDRKYYEDFNIEIARKFNKKWKAIVSYVNLYYDIEIIEQHLAEDPVRAHVGIADITYKLASRKSLRLEAQYLYTKQDHGEYASALLEYTIPHWFFAVMDNYNYGNPDAKKRVHYYSVATGYTFNTTRIALSYGKQEEGILCVGGVCRAVPAANGLTLSVTSSF